jgi:hypothetical protein
LDPVETSTEGLTASTKDVSFSVAPSKQRSKTKYKGWWPEVEDMFAKGLMVKVLFDPKTQHPCVDGLYVRCTLCQMAKGKGDAVFTLRTPFNQFYFNQHIASPTHQQNKIRHEYLENKIKEGNLKRKMQTGMANYFQPKKKPNAVGTGASAEATAHSRISDDTAIPVYEEGISARYARIFIIAF